MTELGLDAEGLTETVLHLNLGLFFIFFLFFAFSPLTRKLQNYFSDTEKSSGLEAEGLMPKLLRLKFYCI
jgi:hypothetical protein